MQSMHQPGNSDLFPCNCSGRHHTGEPREALHANFAHRPAEFLPSAEFALGGSARLLSDDGQEPPSTGDSVPVTKLDALSEARNGPAPGELAGLSEPAHRSVPHDAGHLLLREQLPVLPGREELRTDGVAPDALLRHFRARNRAIWIRLASAAVQENTFDGGKTEEAERMSMIARPRPGSLIQAPEDLAGEELAFQVDGEDALPLFAGDFKKRRPAMGARRVDEDAHAREGSRDLRKGSLRIPCCDASTRPASLRRPVESTSAVLFSAAVLLPSGWRRRFPRASRRAIFLACTPPPSVTAATFPARLNNACTVCGSCWNSDVVLVTARAERADAPVTPGCGATRFPLPLPERRAAAIVTRK